MTMFLRLTTSVTQFPFLHHTYFTIKIKHTFLFKTSVNQTNLKMHFWLNVLWEKRSCSPMNLWRNSEINPSHRVAGGKNTKTSVLLWKHRMPFFVCFRIWCYLQWLVFEILMWVCWPGFIVKTPDWIVDNNRGVCSWIGSKRRSKVYLIPTYWRFSFPCN